MKLIYHDDNLNTKILIGALLRANSIYAPSDDDSKNYTTLHYAYDGNHKLKVGVFLGEFIMKRTNCENTLDTNSYYLVVSYEKALENDKDFISNISKQLEKGFYKKSKFSYQDIYGIIASNKIGISYKTSTNEIVKATNKKKNSNWNFLIFPITF